MTVWFSSWISSTALLNLCTDDLRLDLLAAVLGSSSMRRTNTSGSYRAGGTPPASPIAVSRCISMSLMSSGNSPDVSCIAVTSMKRMAAVR